MALRQVQPHSHNVPATGGALPKGPKGKVLTTGLQRQALGNMANKRATTNQDTKKTFKPSRDLHSTKAPIDLAQRTALPAQKPERQQSQLTKAHRAPRVTKPKQEVETISVMPEQAMDTEVASQPTHRRTRTVTPQPMDVTEMAGELQRKLQLNDAVAEVDLEDMEDPYACAVYVRDIYAYLHKLERELRPDANYMSRQPKINHKMRAILIDWLVLVNIKFNFLQETLYLTVAIIDRFLEVFPASKEQLQLIGVTAMFIASKYEEIYFPEVQDFVYITDNSYTKEQIRQMERIVLRTLNYNLASPGAIQFLRRYSKIGKATVEAHTMAKYFIEVSLIDYLQLKYLPSQIAAASLALAMEILDIGEWTSLLAEYSGYTSTDLAPIKRDVSKLVQSLPLLRQQAVRDKYSGYKYLKIAKHAGLTSSIINTIAQSR